MLPELPPLITDILLSLDDKYIYFSNWLRGGCLGVAIALAGLMTYVWGSHPCSCLIAAVCEASHIQSGLYTFARWAGCSF